MPQPYHLLPRIGSSIAEEWLDIGLQHQIASRYGDAEVAYFKGLRVDPNNGPLFNNLGISSAQQNQMVPALQRLEKATLFDLDNASFQSTAWYNYALALLEVERSDEAVVAIRKSISLGESADAFCAEGMILTTIGLAAEAVEAYGKALKLQPNHPMASFNAVFARTLKNTTPEDNHKIRQHWHKEHGWKGEKKPHDNDKDPDRPLRIGYVGGDFKMHSASFIWRTVLINHDRSLFEPYIYMSMAHDAQADATSKLFMDKANWRDISALDDNVAEAKIREDKIDILIDLAGHTGGNRLSLFTRKPAPIQAHAWGFAHGSGCPEIDYFLADPYAIPKDERQFFAEKIWDLPSIIGFTPPDYGQSGVSAAPVSRDGVFTFGVFGRFEKMSPQSLEAWHKILLRVPDSRLLIKDRMTRAPYAIRRIREAMKDIDPKRILFAQDCAHPEQLLAYQGVDLVLDTFPHTGGVTALEIIYMGVPIVTLYNGQVGGRTTSVALRAIGRQNWIADSINSYVNKAVKLASERAELSEARTKLRESLLKSPLCAGYAKSVEDAFRKMWWQYCGKKYEQAVVA